MNYGIDFPTPPCVEFEKIGSTVQSFCLGEVCTLGYCTSKDLFFFQDGTVEIKKGCHGNDHISIKGKWHREGIAIKFEASYTDTVQQCIADSKKGPGFVSEADSRRMCQKFIRKYTTHDQFTYSLSGEVSKSGDKTIIARIKYFGDGKLLSGPIADYSQKLDGLKYKCAMEIGKEPK